MTFMHELPPRAKNGGPSWLRHGLYRNWYKRDMGDTAFYMSLSESQHPVQVTSHVIKQAAARLRKE